MIDAYNSMLQVKLWSDYDQGNSDKWDCRYAINRLLAVRMEYWIPGV